MRALSLTQPVAYLAGVVRGDAWCTRLALGLRVADEDFARAFALAIGDAFGVATVPKTDERGYWLVRTSNKTGRFNLLAEFDAASGDQRAAWLRGLFDSEGNASLRQHPTYGNCRIRRVAIYSTNVDTLSRAAAYLAALGITSRIGPHRGGAGRKGTKVVYQLCVQGSRPNYERFATLVGSTIARKQSVLDQIPGSYSPDLTAARRAAQLRGVAARKARGGYRRAGA